MVVVGAKVVVVVGRGVVDGVEAIVGHVWQGSQVGAGGQEGGGGHVAGAAVVVVMGWQWPHESAHFVEHLRDWHFAGVPHFFWQNFAGLLSWQIVSWRSSRSKALSASNDMKGRGENDIIIPSTTNLPSA